jgi:hypothetical protein
MEWGCRKRVQGPGSKKRSTSVSPQSTVNTKKELSYFVCWCKALGVMGAEVKGYEVVSSTPLLRYSIKETTRYA